MGNAMGCTVAQLSCTDSPDLVLWKAAERGDDKAIEMLIASGVDVDVANDYLGVPLGNFALGAPTGMGLAWKTTPLHIAAWHGHANAVNRLVVAGANPEKTDAEYGLTPLHLAAGNGHVEVVALLLAAGANKESRTMNGRTALYLASRNQKYAVEGCLDIVAQFVRQLKSKCETVQALDHTLLDTLLYAIDASDKTSNSEVMPLIDEVLQLCAKQLDDLKAAKESTAGLLQDCNAKDSVRAQTLLKSIENFFDVKAAQLKKYGAFARDIFTKDDGENPRDEFITATSALDSKNEMLDILADIQRKGVSATLS